MTVPAIPVDEPGESSGSDTSITTYVHAFFSDWLTGMSGPLSVPFAALALWVSNGRLKALWGCLAVLSAGFASYRVWRAERRYGTAELRAVRSAADREIENLKSTTNKEIENLKAERDAAKLRPYDEEHRRLAEAKVSKLPEESKDLVWFLLHHGKQESEELRKHCTHDPLFHAAVQRAREAGLVLDTQENPGRPNARYFWEVNPEFKAVLQDLLGRRESRFFH